MSKFFSCKKFLSPTVALFLLCCLAYALIAEPVPAYASLPWEEPLTELKESITGTVAKAICAIVVCVTGVMIGMGEGGAAGRIALRLVFGLALAVGFTQIISMF